MIQNLSTIVQRTLDLGDREQPGLRQVFLFAYPRTRRSERSMDLRRPEGLRQKSHGFPFNGGTAGGGGPVPPGSLDRKHRRQNTRAVETRPGCASANILSSLPSGRGYVCISRWTGAFLRRNAMRLPSGV